MEIKIGVDEYIQKVMQHWNEWEVKIKCIEPYIEAVGSEGEVWFDYVKVYYVG